MNPTAVAQLETKLGTDTGLEAGGCQFGDGRLICGGDLQQLRRGLKNTSEQQVMADKMEFFFLTLYITLLWAD